MKNITFGSESRQALLTGIELHNKAVASSMGARGRNTMIQQPNGSVVSTKDGWTISKAIESSDPQEQMAVTLMREVTEKANNEAGDGTTTSSVLASAITREGIQRVSAGYNPIGIKRGIDKGVRIIVDMLAERSKEIESKEELINVSTISANSDKELGALIAEALEAVGADGVVTVEESSSYETHLEFTEGMSIDRGMITPYFATNPENMTTVLEDCYVLITDTELGSMREFLPILEPISMEKKPLLIIANDVTGDLLPNLIVNTANGKIKACAIKPPSFGDNRKAMLEDLAILTGGEILSENLGTTIADFTDLSKLGRAKKITVSKTETVIVEGAGSEEAIEERITLIKNNKEEETSDYEIERLDERLAKLAGGVAVLNVGANTEVELQEKKDRVEDALSASRAGIEEGIVAGGGVTLAQISKDLDSYDTSDFTEAEIVGFNILKKAIEEPCRQIAENAGLEGGVVVKEVKNGEVGYGIDVSTLETVDMMKAGIIDPVKVTRVALESASSVAGLILTTEASIAIVEDDK